jgi:hypothetical protein
MIRFHQWSDFMYSYMFLMSFYTIFDGMNYLVVDGANLLKQGCVWWCPRMLNPSSWGILSTCASALSTDTSSEPRAIVGFAECHHAEIDKNWLASGRTVTTSIALRVLLLWLLATQPLELIEMIDLLEANHCLRVTESKLGLLHCFEFQKTFFLQRNSSMVPQVHGGLQGGSRSGPPCQMGVMSTYRSW